MAFKSLPLLAGFATAIALQCSSNAIPSGECFIGWARHCLPATACRVAFCVLSGDCRCVSATHSVLTRVCASVENNTEERPLRRKVSLADDVRDRRF